MVDFARHNVIGLLVVGDPRGVLNGDAGARQNLATRTWREGQLLDVLHDKAQRAGIEVVMVDERGTSSTCCRSHKTVPKPKGGNFSCRHCGLGVHRDLVEVGVADDTITAANATASVAHTLPPISGGSLSPERLKICGYSVYPFTLNVLRRLSVDTEFNGDIVKVGPHSFRQEARWLCPTVRVISTAWTLMVTQRHIHMQGFAGPSQRNIEDASLLLESVI